MREEPLSFVAPILAGKKRKRKKEMDCARWEWIK
jgi:hypothetical protein